MGTLSEEILAGRQAIKRQNPKPGETPYYYLKPNSDPFQSISDDDVINVQSPDEPNPALQTPYHIDSKSNNTMTTDIGVGSVDERDVGVKGTEYIPSYLPEKYVELYNIMAKELDRHEGKVDHFYLDTNGFVTIGSGMNVNDKDKFMNLPMMNGDHFATHKEKETCYNTFMKHKNDGKYGSNFSSGWYKNDCSLRLSPDVSEKMKRDHLAKDIVSLDKRNIITTMPLNLQMATVDIQYNTGKMYDGEGGFPKYLEAHRRGDIETMAKESHRKGVSAERNQWTRNKILEGF